MLYFSGRMCTWQFTLRTSNQKLSVWRRCGISGHGSQSDLHCASPSCFSPPWNMAVVWAGKENIPLFSYCRASHWWSVCWIDKKAVLSQNLIWRISLTVEYICDKLLLPTAFDWDISYARIFWTVQDQLEKSNLDQFTDSAGLSLVP